MTALSPFRYLQIAKYLVHRWVDNIPSLKGKHKAVEHLQRFRTRRSRNAVKDDNLVRSTSLETHSSAHHHDTPLAGPSRMSSAHGSEHHHHPHHHSNNYGHQPQPQRPKGDKPSRSKVYFPKLAPDPKWPPGPTDIYRYMNDERLMVGRGAVKPPKEIVVLCHGLYGFSTATPIPLFPSLKLHYWANVLDVLRNKIGANVVVVGVKGTGSIQERAEQMHEFLKKTLPKGAGVNFVAHSMGGLDCRYLISTLKPTSYTPLSLTTIGTPHRGSPFMDWCAANIGVGSAAAVATAALTSGKNQALPPYSLKSPLLSRVSNEAKSDKVDAFGSLAAGLTSYLLSIFDSPAYSNLTTSFLRDHFNPSTPDSPNVKYTSVAGRISKMSVLHPLWFPKLVLDAAADNGYAEDESNTVYGPDGKRAYEGNDGLVSVSSAKWGEYIGAVDECHHWDLRGEGGLFPSGAKTSSDEEELKAQKKEQEDQVPGEWDWEGHEAEHAKHGVNAHLGLGESAIARQAQAVMAKFEQDEASATAGKAGTPPKSSTNSSSDSSSSSSSSSWDLAQVGQVIDWVADYLPGDRSTETGKKQLEEATLEKQGQQEKEKENSEKRKKEKFDLARFYGGLMIKLREDGF
ncbi:triacylglycerol lipase [Kwoniella heveanensis CBS 569]|nr:triacylglycerol lipase [Kwoniella heveanensis CBS 569]